MNIAYDRYNGRAFSLTEIEELIVVHSPSVIVAGHYCLAANMQELSHEGQAEQTSFAYGTALVRRALQGGAESYLVLWINDIAVPTEERAEYKASYRLPENYQAAMHEHSLSQDRLIVKFESTMRNKASVLLRKLYKQSPALFERVDSREMGLLRCVEDFACEASALGTSFSYVVAGPNGERLVVKDGPNPKCNLILASFFQNIAKQFSPRIQFNIFNEIYSRRIGLGVHVFRHLLNGSTPIINMFCDGNKINVEEEAEVPLIFGFATQDHHFVGE